MTHEPTASRGIFMFALLLRFIIAPVVLFSSGFFTADFLLSGMYSWPRTSRVIVLTLTVCVLAYEFVYKEQRGLAVSPSSAGPVRAVMYSCALPYLAGALALLALARLAVTGESH